MHPIVIVFSLVEPKSEILNFEDNNVQFRFVPSPENIWVAIRNKTDQFIGLECGVIL